MVNGLQRFKEFFEEYSDNYVLIGGTACSIIFDEIGIDFRATDVSSLSAICSMTIITACYFAESVSLTATAF